MERGKREKKRVESEKMVGIVREKRERHKQREREREKERKREKERGRNSVPRYSHWSPHGSTKQVRAIKQASAAAAD